jgi:hypothetical protein
MRAWVAEQDWLTLERLPTYAPELNPVELLWSSLTKRELANLVGDHLADVADATEQGIHRINANPRKQLLEICPALERALSLTNEGPALLLTGYQTPAAIRRSGVRRIETWLKNRKVKGAVGVHVNVALARSP